MKKTLLIGLAALLTISMAASANAGAFFGLRGGYENYKVDGEGDKDFLLGAFVGYHYSFFRAEAEYMYHPSHTYKESGFESETHSAMGNLYFSPPIKTFIRPYIMGGAGMAFHSVDVAQESDSNTSFAWQIGAGLELEFTENVFLEGGVRLMDMGQVEFKNAEADVEGFSYFLGLRFEY